MQLTSLNGTTYMSTKRTAPRNHQADLAAREHHQTKQQKRVGSLERLRGYLLDTERLILPNAVAPFKLLPGRIELLKVKVVNLKRMIQQTEAAIQRG